MKSSPRRSRYPRRILYLWHKDDPDGGLVEVVCTEETLGNYWGHHTGAGPKKTLRFPKSEWRPAREEVQI